jgi:hypothetical protein
MHGKRSRRVLLGCGTIAVAAAMFGAGRWASAQIGSPDKETADGDVAEAVARLEAALEEDAALPRFTGPSGGFEVTSDSSLLTPVRPYGPELG